MINNFYVYKHISPNNKVYIGITSLLPQERWCNGEGYNKQKLFYRAIQKYGWDNFKHEILFEGLTKEEACQKEIELIAEYKSNNSDFGYNLTAGGEGPNGYHHTEDAKRKIGNASKGNKYALGAVRTEEFKNNARLKALGRKPSFEAIEKWRKSREGFYHSDETKRKIGEANKGNKNMLGKHHSDETKKRLADVARNRVFSEETREKLRQSAKRQWERYHKKKEEESKDVKI